MLDCGTPVRSMWGVCVCVYGAWNAYGVCLHVTSQRCVKRSRAFATSLGSLASTQAITCCAHPVSWCLVLQVTWCANVTKTLPSRLCRGTAPRWVKTTSTNIQTLAIEIQSEIEATGVVCTQHQPRSESSTFMFSTHLSRVASRAVVTGEKD